MAFPQDPSNPNYPQGPPHAGASTYEFWGDTHIQSERATATSVRERKFKSRETTGMDPGLWLQNPRLSRPPHRLSPWPLVHEEEEALLVLHPPGPTLPRAPGSYSVFAEPTRSPASAP